MNTRANTAYMRPRDAEAPVLQGISRDSFFQLIDSIHDRLPHPVSKPAMNTLKHMLIVTRISDWTTPGKEPCCFMAQVQIAHDAKCSPGRVRAHESELVAAGLIDKRTMGNGARSGWHGRGIYFTPAIERLDEFRAIKAMQDAERAEAALMRGLRSTHKRHLKASIEELTAHLGAGHEDVEHFTALLGGWPTADKLHRMTLNALIEHECIADHTCREALDILENTLKTSGRPLVFGESYIQDTTQTSDSESCNANVDTEPTSKLDGTVDSIDAPNGASCNEEQNEEARAAHKSEFLEKLGPDRLYELASNDLRLHLDGRRSAHRPLSFHDFVVAAQARLPELGVNYSAWTAAARTMGEDTATMCVLILDASRDRPGLPVRNPGGYLRGMTRAAERGELNIIGSLIGLSERRAGED